MGLWLLRRSLDASVAEGDADGAAALARELAHECRARQDVERSRDARPRTHVHVQDSVRPSDYQPTGGLPESLQPFIRRGEAARRDFLFYGGGNKRAIFGSWTLSTWLAWRLKIQRMLETQTCRCGRWMRYDERRGLWACSAIGCDGVRKPPRPQVDVGGGWTKEAHDTVADDRAESEIPEQDARR